MTNTKNATSDFVHLVVDGKEEIMLITKAMKMRIYPSKEQAEKIDATLNCCRFVYNHMLERNSKVYQRRGEHLNYNAMQNLLPVMKKYLPWLAEADSQALKYACRQLDNAFRKFFQKQAGYPNFKSRKNLLQSYTTTNAKSIRYELGRINLPCLGWMKCSGGRLFDGKICYATISRKRGRYYASITYKEEKDIQPVYADPDRVIGLDYKSDGLFVSSDGTCADMPHFFRESEDALARKQRMLSKKQGSKKGEPKSNRYQKQLATVQKIHEHAANQRSDFLHKTSIAIAKQADAVAVEDLNMQGMSRSLKLGKATMDNGYREFLRQLSYKLAWRGKKLIKVGRLFPSSQLCSCCGYRNREVKNLNIRRWTCPVCGVSHDRDVNAAKNIRDEGLRLLGYS